MKYTNLLFIILFLRVFSTTQAATQIAHLGNSWYPDKKPLLERTINKLSKKAAQKYNAFVESSSIRALIVPHAGYAFSGEVAASVYRLLNKNSIKKVIILAPDHSASFTGIALPSFDTYQTAMGVIKTKSSDIQKLLKNELFNKNSTVFATEHSLEIQLPFIQTYLSTTITILPLIVGQLTCAQAHTIAQALKPFINQETLVIVSTDFTHYGKHFNFEPFTDTIPENIRRLDSRAVEHIEAGQCAPFEKFIEQTQTTICGQNPLKILLSLLEINAFDKVEPRLIAYDSSGLQENNFENSVSYIGIIFTQQKLDSLPIEHQLTQQEQRSLLQEAKDVLNNLFDTKIPANLLYPLQSLGITRQHGAFTTLETNTPKGKQLRGCIGRITTNEPLYKTIAAVTRDAALHDSRFTPVTQQELPELSVKLSILTPPHPITSYKKITLGKDGVILQQNGKSAVFLPEVPLEFKWNLNQMLEELSEKAGLDRNAWQDQKTQFNVFRTFDIE